MGGSRHYIFLYFPALQHKGKVSNILDNNQAPVELFFLIAHPLLSHDSQANPGNAECSTLLVNTVQFYSSDNSLDGVCASAVACMQFCCFLPMLLMVNKARVLTVDR